MKSFTTAIALASIVPAIMSLTVNTPASVVQCQPQLLTWTDGIAPFYLSIIPGGKPAATPLKSFDTQTGNSMTWKVDQPAGTSITVSLKDATGAVAYSDVVVIQQGTDNSCLHSAGSPDPDPAPAPPSAQDASVNTANAIAPTSSGTVSQSGGVAAQTGTIRSASGAPGVTATRPASVAVSSSATQSVSRTSTTARAAATSASGAESSLSGHSYGFVGAVGLIGALFL